MRAFGRHAERTAVHGWGSGRRRQALLVVPALVLGMVPAALVVTASSAGAAAGDPVGVSVTLEGCRGSTGSFPAAGPFVCPDADYTTGNLGSGWNELDLVPHRLTLSAGNSAPASQTFKLAVVADNEDAGHPGYDAMSTLTKNTSLSNGTCAPTISDQTSLTPGLGGTDTSIYRTIELVQAKNTKCVFDYYERLALGSAQYPGASLHSNAANQNLGTAGIGARDVSIPVKEIQPQSIDKNVTASRGSDAVWSVSKSATPATLTFGDTCAGGATFSRTVAITVSWNKVVSASGDVTIVTYLYATNPSHRAITVDVADVVSAGGVTLYTIDPAAVLVPANSSNFSLLGVDGNGDPIPDVRGVSTSATSISDTATATYIDQATGIAVPGTTTVSKTTAVTTTGTVSNTTATITDSESITGTGLTFSVATPSVGAFTGGYVAGTHTTGPVGWSSGTQSTSGSVTFNKTVYLDQARITSGTLSDTAHLDSSGGQSINSNTVSIPISSNATVSLTIAKTIPVVLGAGDGTRTFTFPVTGPNSYSSSPTVTFSSGQGGTLAPRSTTLTGLEPGAYVVNETTLAPYAAQPPRNVAITLPNCSSSVQIDNNFGPAIAQVRKITLPAGHEAGWVFTLTGPGLPLAGVTATTTGTGAVVFQSGGGNFLLQEGAYIVTETAQANWDNTAVSRQRGSDAAVDQSSAHQCTFSVNYDADADQVFSCVFTNVERGTITLTKTVGGVAPSGTDAFTFQLRRNASTASNGSILDTQVANAGNGGVLPFQENGSTELVPGTYQICEFIAVGWSSTIQTMTGAFVPGTGGDTTADNSYVCVPFVLAPGQTGTLTVDNTPPPGGMAKTIGFWKNHASCKSSNGKQQPVLDQTLALGGGSILIGDLSVTTCAVAVDLLDKRAIADPALVGDGKKMASDAAFNNVAQLLAYRLNIIAGAGDKPAANAAAAGSQVILDAINFNGNTHLPFGPGQASALNAYAQTLDSYNNNTL